MPIYALDGVEPVLPAEGRYWIAPDANIIGKVRLEEDASIWFGCTLRGDREWIVVGARSNVQERTVIHTDPGFPLLIGEDCTVGHGCILHGCTLGAGSLVGMGATILNGAKIGRNCLVGANALVTEGKVFPDGSLIIGSPAKAVREMSAEEIAKMQRGASHYVNNARAYAAGLRRLD